MSNILPTGYTQLEYLQSTGTQYIDTGVNGKSGLKAELKFMFLTGMVGSDKYIIGCSNLSGRTYFGTYQSKWMYGYGEYYQADGIADNTLYDCEVSWIQNNQYVKVNSNSIMSYQLADTINLNLSFYLFSRNSGEGSERFNSSSKLYYCKIYNNNILVRNFIPAKRNSDSVLGMYDLVSNTFYTNAGTGEFIAGPVVYNGYKLSNFTYFKGSTLPAGYLQLEYIESNGTQWIDTGIQADLRNDFAFTGKCGWHHNARGMLLSAYLMSSYPNNLSIELSEDIKFRFYCGATDIFRLDSGAEIGKLYDFTTTYIASTGAVSLSINGSSASGTVPEAGRILNSGTLVLGSDQGHRFPFGIFGPLKFVSNSITKFEYIPAKRISDGVLGMYDLVSNTFLTNAGTGTFVAGPVVYHDSKLTYYQIYNPRVSGYTELEYLESTGTQYIDTGIVPIRTEDFYIKTYHLDFSPLWGADNFVTARDVRTGVDYFRIFHGNGANQESLPVNTWIESNYSASTTIFTSHGCSTPAQTTICNENLMLFKRSSNVYGIGRISCCTIGNRRNFIPMRRNSDSVLGMYDLANSGKNHWDPSLPYVSGYLKADGVVDTNVSKPYYCIDYIEVKPNTKYTYSVTLTAAGAGDGIRICFYDENKNFVGTREGGETTSPTRYHYPITSPANAKYVRISHVATFEAAQLEEGQLETAYEPFPFYTNKGTGTFIAGPMVQRTNITNPIIYI